MLEAAIATIGGAERPGQHQMAAAIAAGLTEGQHLLVQAGTGTGKSLGYLAPALLALADGSADRIVVATATLALQTQLATKDIPVALDAVQKVTGRRPKAAMLKGRSNYACLHRIREGVPETDQGVLITGAELADTMSTAQGSGTTATDSALGAEVVALREWAEAELEDKGTGDRDAAPSHTEKAWQQVSVPVRECLGAQRCPYGDVCFVEKSRDVARASELVVTNHALLAIDAMHGGTALPEHDAVIIDEAHELVQRVTGAASMELSPQMIERVARRAMTWLEDELSLEFLELGDVLRNALDAVDPERITDADSAVVSAAESIRTTARKVVSELGGGQDDADRRQAQAAVKEVFDVAERIAGLDDHDVVYVNERDRFGREVRVSPLAVAGLLRDKVLSDRTAVFCSATLRIGGEFTGVAGSFGLRADERLPDERPAEPDHDADDHQTDSDSDSDSDDENGRGADEPHSTQWRALDVGSPFDYRRQGILFLARELPPPGREGLSKEALAEIAELTWAAGGRTLGLFASRRNAEAAARHVRAELPKMTVLCQGDAQLSELTKRFIAEPETSLFGTLSLWQGIDVPGETCRLVIIDKIPFPRPDDPLMQARQQAVAEAGGNGFMAVAASHAALLLAQGSGRLIRTVGDKGMVAVLDPRLVTARYGSFLRASMPEFWTTSDRAVAVEALRRLGD